MTLGEYEILLENVKTNWSKYPKPIKNIVRRMLTKVLINIREGNNERI